ncbi:hypothetical protein PGTUg99_026312 [Puccinia graminis f. sp. tritici]|uniref:CCHC-type domain-containing protein n=1 Tax=Puccinia graminis f. sp. tritici TaxID=56615 RepID=A0A5B0RE42_PUCGR|nr:hypothetical protein PGTUg99_026312 [Puccinia graminis f. sp. tritici]
MAKILVIKPKPGRFKALFAKLTTINKKNGPFDLVICVSDLFKIPENDEEQEELDDLIAQNVEVPVRTFAMLGSFKFPPKVQELLDKKDGSICNNLELLAPNSILTLSTVANLRIANFGGVYEPTNYNSSTEDLDTQSTTNYIHSGQLSNFLTKIKSISTTNNDNPGIDILLTHSLPQLLTVNSKVSPKDYNAPAWGCPPITEVLRAAQPRYHFSGGAVAEFWEREPWLWDPPSAPVKAPTNDYPSITRFVNLGQFGNEAKERWFYAFNIVSISEAKPTKPLNATPSPYSLSTRPNQKRGLPAFGEDGFDSGPNFRFGEMEPNKKKTRTGAPPSNYVCKICQTSGHWIQECPEKVEKPRQPKDGYVCRICNTPGHLIQDCPEAAQRSGPPKDAFQPKEIGPDSCWFCLSNPQLAKHLIASIGSETYLTLPKGQLPDTTNNCPVPGGGHVLLIPIAHYPSLLALPSELAIPIVAEMEHYKSALKRCYEAYSASMVSFEVAKLSGRGARAGHAHLQICPVPNELADQVETMFVEEGKKQGIELVDEVALKEMKDEMKEAISYFRVGLPDGKGLVHLMKPDEKFNLQFGRITLANLLGTPDRANWKTCERSETDEKQDCRTFQKVFAAFEPKF